MGRQTSDGVGPEEARRLAIRCLSQGNFDGRDIHGAVANALESIAWSLVGMSGSIPEEADNEEHVTDELQRIALFRAEP